MTAVKDQIYSQAVAHRKGLTFPFIGITGSNGKTTTKRMLSAILSEAGRLYNFDDQADRPDVLARELLTLKNSYQWALVKLGAAEPQQLLHSAQLIKPHAAIITNVGEAHFARYGSTEKIAAEKKQILNALPADGVIFLNRDNEYTRDMVADFPGQVIFFGLSELSDYYATEIVHLGPLGTSLTVMRKAGTPIRFLLPIYSDGDVYNALAAIAAADYFHIPEDVTISGLTRTFQLPPGRGVMHSCAHHIYIIDDTHDATPQSLMQSTQALLHFRNDGNRLFLIMGDMTDLGKQSKNMHEMMGHYLAGMPIDVVVLIGRDVLKTAQAIESEPVAKRMTKMFISLSEAQEFVLSMVRENDVLLVEGSESENLANLVKELAAHLQTGS